MNRKYSVSYSTQFLLRILHSTISNFFESNGIKTFVDCLGSKPYT